MNLLRQLMEMAKSKQKRGRAAKLARKKKLENPTQDAQRNLAAIAAQTSGAGAHKEKEGERASRTRQKKKWRKEEDV